LLILSKHSFLIRRLYIWEYVTDPSINLLGLVKKEMEESMQVESLIETPANPFPPAADVQALVSPQPASSSHALHITPCFSTAFAAAAAVVASADVVDAGADAAAAISASAAVAYADVVTDDASAVVVDDVASAANVADAAFAAAVDVGLDAGHAVATVA